MPHRSPGSALSDGARLVYESGGIAQAPWVYDSVRVISDSRFDRCILVGRREQNVRVSCTRGDTLFERDSDGGYRAARPIGENMEIVLPARAGGTLTFATGVRSTTRIDGRDVQYLLTTIQTRDSAGVVIRRLTEHYAPSLLTAVWGKFETPGPDGRLGNASEFVLAEIHDPADQRVSLRPSATRQARGSPPDPPTRRSR